MRPSGTRSLGDPISASARGQFARDVGHVTVVPMCPIRSADGSKRTDALVKPPRLDSKGTRVDAPLAVCGQHVKIVRKSACRRQHPRLR